MLTRLTRLTRRKLALLLGAVALGTPILVACGFDAATDRPYTPGVGVSDQSGEINVLSAVVVSESPGSGTFVASLSNQNQQEAGTLDSLSPAGGQSLQVDEFEPVEVGAGALVNLADNGGLGVTGDFGAGDFVDVTLGFSSGERLTMQVPVVDDSGYYAGLDGGPIEDPAATESAATETE